MQGANLFAVILGITTGTMLGRVLSTKRGIDRILEVLVNFNNNIWHPELPGLQEKKKNSKSNVGGFGG